MHKFEPIFKPTLWGSETWIVSAVKGSESVVLCGQDRGMTLPEIIARDGADFLGKENIERFGGAFPLLIKFIDARQDLSIQVHPNDELSKKRHGKMGKNEMWYVVQADRGSRLIAGFSKAMGKENYAAKVADGSIEEDLNKVLVNPGDCFYIPAGRVHGIGGGMKIAEIQQTSDVTYRIYDYMRRDREGNLRELHTELALEAINFDDITSNPGVNYTEKRNESVRLVESPFFTTSEIILDRTTAIEQQGRDTFRIYICLEGQCCILDDKGEGLFLKQGEALVIPANTKKIIISPDEYVKLLESFV